MPVDDKTIFFVTRKIWLTAVGWKSNSNSLRNVDWATCFGLSFKPLKQPLASSPCHRFPLQITPSSPFHSFCTFFNNRLKMLHALRQRPLQARNIKARFALMKDNSGKAYESGGRVKVRDPTVHTKQRQNEGGTAEKKERTANGRRHVKKFANIAGSCRSEFHFGMGLR